MNRNEAAALWRSDQQALAQRGVVLPGVTRYLTPDEKADFGIAMDAAFNALPGPLVTDPSSAIPWFLANTIDPDVIEVVFAPLDFAEILGERKVGDWTDRTRMFQVVESTGEVSSYGDYNNNGRAGVNVNFPAFQSYLFQTIVRYGELEAEMAGLAKLNYVASLQKTAADLLNRFGNLTYAFGLAGLQNYGIINNPYLSAAITPATKAAGGTGWFSGNVPNASANEVYNDIVALVAKLIAQTGGTLDAKSKMTLAMSPSSAIALSFTNSFGVNVEDLLKKNYPNMTVKTAPQYGVASSTNPQGASSAGNIMQLIPDALQGQQVAYAAFNERLRAHKLIPGLSSWEQKYTSGSWGSILRLPVAVVQMLGI